MVTGSRGQKVWASTFQPEYLISTYWTPFCITEKQNSGICRSTPWNLKNSCGKYWNIRAQCDSTQNNICYKCDSASTQMHPNQNKFRLIVQTPNLLQFPQDRTLPSGLQSFTPPSIPRLACPSVGWFLLFNIIREKPYPRDVPLVSDSCKWIGSIHDIRTSLWEKNTSAFPHLQFMKH